MPRPRVIKPEWKIVSDHYRLNPFDEDQINAIAKELREAAPNPDHPNWRSVWIGTVVAIAQVFVGTEGFDTQSFYEKCGLKNN